MPQLRQTSLKLSKDGVEHDHFCFNNFFAINLDRIYFLQVPKLLHLWNISVLVLGVVVA